MRHSAYMCVICGKKPKVPKAPKFPKHAPVTWDDMDKIHALLDRYCASSWSQSLLVFSSGNEEHVLRLNVCSKKCMNTFNRRAPVYIIPKTGSN